MWCTLLALYYSNNASNSALWFIFYDSKLPGSLIFFFLNLSKEKKKLLTLTRGDYERIKIIWLQTPKIKHSSRGTRKKRKFQCMEKIGTKEIKLVENRKAVCSSFFLSIKPSTFFLCATILMDSKNVVTLTLFQKHAYLQYPQVTFSNTKLNLLSTSFTFFRLTLLVSFEMVDFWWSRNEYKILARLVRERLICTTKKLGMCSSSYARGAKNLLSILCCHNRRVINEEELQRKKQIRSSSWACSVKMSTFLVNPQVSFSHQKT